MSPSAPHILLLRVPLLALRRPPLVPPSEPPLEHVRCNNVRPKPPGAPGGNQQQKQPEPVAEERGEQLAEGQEGQQVAHALTQTQAQLASRVQQVASCAVARLRCSAQKAAEDTRRVRRTRARERLRMTKRTRTKLHWRGALLRSRLCRAARRSGVHGAAAGGRARRAGHPGADGAGGRRLRGGASLRHRSPCDRTRRRGYESSIVRSIA